MAALIKSKSKLADSSQNPQIGDRQANIADPASTLTATLTAGNIATITATTPTRVTLTYTTDDPGISPDGAQTIADGDAPTGLETCQTFDEIEGTLADIVTMLTELAADHATQVTLNAELIADHATFITDITQNRAAVNSALDVLEEHGLMTAS